MRWGQWVGACLGLAILLVPVIIVGGGLLAQIISDEGGEESYSGGYGAGSYGGSEESYTGGGPLAEPADPTFESRPYEERRDLCQQAADAFAERAFARLGHRLREERWLFYSECMECGGPMQVTARFGSDRAGDSDYHIHCALRYSPSTGVPLWP